MGTQRDGESLRFADPEGLEHELAVIDTPDAPLIAEHPEIPSELALQGFDSVRAYSRDRERSRALLEETLEFGPAWRGLGGPRRAARRPLRARPAARAAGLQGAGTRPPRRLGVHAR